MIFKQKILNQVVNDIAKIQRAKTRMEVEKIMTEAFTKMKLLDSAILVLHLTAEINFAVNEKRRQINE